MSKINLAWLFLLSTALAGFLLLPGPAFAQDKARQNGLFEVKLSYSIWDLGGAAGSINGFDGEICPPWPWPWPWRKPLPRPKPWPQWDLGISYFDIDKDGLTRAIPLELGLRFPFSLASRVTPYFGVGLGYYLLDGKAPGIGDELGAYGVLGVDIHLGRGPQPEPWGLSLEAAYREVGGDLDLGGPTFKAGVGFNF